MAAWLIPALKAVLPHVGTIISAASPAFTRKKTDANQTLLLQEQIAELQSAASQNAVHIKELAEQLQTTLAVLEDAALIAQKKLRWVVLLCLVATALSALALCVVLLA
jgi:hypothetical protein